MSSDNDRALSITAVITSAVPYLGGPVSNILSGIVTERKLNRVKDCLDTMAEALRGFESEVSKTYVKTDEFEELLERTLNQVAEERHEEKRTLYGSFLADLVKNPGNPYDEELEFLRILEQLQLDHIRLLKAIMTEPNFDSLGLTGSINATLRKRVPDIPDNRQLYLIQQLNELKLTRLASPNMMMTARGAEDLRSAITPIGYRFVRYLKPS